MKKIVYFILFLVMSSCALINGNTKDATDTSTKEPTVVKTTPEPVIDQTVIDKTYEQAVALYSKQQYPESTAAFLDYIKSSKDNDRTIKSYFYLGDMYRYNLDYDMARNYYKKVIEKTADASNTSKAQFYIARCYDEQERYREAIEYYNTMLLSDGAEKALRDIVSAQIETIITNHCSVEDLKHIVTKLPPTPALAQAYLRLGKHYLDTRQYTESEKVFTQMKTTGKTQEAETFLKVAQQKGKNPQVKIGVMLPFSGSYGQLAERIYHAINHMQNYKNKNLPKETPILVVREDTGDEVKQIGAVYEKLVAEGVQIIIGPLYSQVADALVPFVEKHKVPVIFLVANDDLLHKKSSYFFRNSFRKQDEAITLADYAVKKLRLTNFGVLVPNDDRSMNTGNVFKRRVETYRAVMPVFQSYNKGETTYTTYLNQVKTAFVEGLFIQGTNRRDLEQLVPTIPYVGLNIAVLADSTLYDEYLFRVLAEHTNGMIIATYFNTNDFGILEKDIYDSFKASFNYTLDQYNILGLDAFNVAYEALVRTGGVSGDELVQALKSVKDMKGLCGRITMSSEGDMVKDIFLYRVESGVPKKVDFSADTSAFMAFK